MRLIIDLSCTAKQVSKVDILCKLLNGKLCGRKNFGRKFT